ncbi:hypothetical protein EDI_064990 [Entamoeba dispar SAW760]|uniref:Uncharacterized protein n=1 Tax=Entamoeba dispar (strain ATCC PRA-260 / SAW760) TaxID=370354 RepID=B0EDL3_ENTDS|nr:uncharacterized protein EDI_064990 [Entamoeba dispar SAW760]EDR27376.1 hypothetical protein EDI_064990 [Entamoeba dispar SAW760]|eukprot:EDR27376.1 hypothetical protein EDI_064990 [Entamoeba dispar SAW760]
MTILEKVYLANVLLYFSDYIDFLQFSFINSKCQDTLHIIKQFPYGIKLSKKIYQVFKMNTKINKILNIIPNIESITVPNVLYVSIINKNIQQIGIKRITIPQIIQLKQYDNIISIKIIISYNEFIDLRPYHQLKQIYIVDINNTDETMFILDHLKRYSFFRYKTIGFSTQKIYDRLKDCDIEKIIFDIISDEDNNISKSILRRLPHVFFYKRILSDNDKHFQSFIYHGKNLKVISKSINLITQFNSLYFPSSLSFKTIPSCVQKFTQLTSISSDYCDISNIPNNVLSFKTISYNKLIFPQTLQSLTLRLYKNIDIPSILTSLFLEDITVPLKCEYDETPNCFNLIKCSLLKELMIQCYDIEFTSLKSLQHLTKISIIRKYPSHISYNSQLFPLKLQELRCDELLLPKKLRIKKLVIDCSSTSRINLIQYNSLTSLKINSLCHKNILLPFSLIKIHFNGLYNRIETLNLSNEPSLNQIIIENCKAQLFMKLPEDFDLLCIINSSNCMLTSISNINKVIIHSSLMDTSRIYSNMIITN